MQEQEFVDASISFQLGDLSKGIAQSTEALTRALASCSGGSVGYVPGHANFYTYARDTGLVEMEPAKLNPHSKTGAVLTQILALKPEFGFIVDMQDRRVRDVADEGNAPFPVFSFNRVSDRRQRLLWPLTDYHDFGNGHFVDAVRPDAVQWEAKVSRAVWRGSTGGRVMASRRMGLDDGIRMKVILRQLGRAPERYEALEKLAKRVTRHHALSFVQGDARFDFGFFDRPDAVVSQMPFHQHLVRPKMPQSEMQRCRYIAVLRGLDVGSSFYWVMNSGSVGLVMETPFETFGSVHFQPWTHFIPFQEDCSDLFERFDWAEANQDECRAMTVRASAVCALLARADLRSQILQGVIAQLNKVGRS